MQAKPTNLTDKLAAANEVYYETASHNATMRIDAEAKPYPTLLIHRNGKLVMSVTIEIVWDMLRDFLADSRNAEEFDVVMQRRHEEALAATKSTYSKFNK